MDINLHVNYPLLLTYFNKTCIFPETFSKNAGMSYYVKISPLGADLFMRWDGRTDMTKLTVAFRKIAKAADESRISVTYRSRIHF